MKKLITIFTFIPFLCFGQWNQLGADVVPSPPIVRMGADVAFDANGTSFVASNELFMSSQGKVQIYQWNGTSWQQKGADIIEANPFENFGKSIDISANGNTVVIGAPSIDPGYSAVYEWNGSSWVQKGTNIIGDTGLLNGAGFAVSISADGNIIAIGATGNSNSNGSFTGQVKVYEWDGTSWVQIGSDIDGQNSFDSFGTSVSLSSNGNILAIGASGAGTGGEASVFQWDGTSWIQLGATLSGGQSNAFGITNDLDALGTTISVGATSNDLDFGSGYIEVYTWDGANWNQKGSRLESDPTGDDFFNKSNLNADGNIIVAGGFGTGLVHVYKFDGIDWNIINLIFTNDDAFGDAVDINDDGSRIVVGAPGAGFVSVFENPCPAFRSITEAVPTGVYRATDSIISDGSVSLSSSNGNVEYRAGNTIELLADFLADGSVNFEAVIGGCP